MTLRRALRNSVRTRLLRSWLILGASAIAASGLVFLLLIAIEHGDQRSRILDDLRLKAATISRRLSAELLVGERGTIDPVMAGLRQELGIDTIALLPPGIDCKARTETTPCASLATDNYAWLTERLPHLPDSRYVFIGQRKNTLEAAIHWSTLAVATLSLLGVLLGGIILQWSAIRRHILLPINALLDPKKKRGESENWPTEIRRIEDKLQSLLAERDRATHEAHRLKTETLVHDLSQRILHDLKSPLGTLGMMIETDLRDVPAETKDSIRRVLSRIRAIVDTNLKEYSADALARTTTAETSTSPAEMPAGTVGGAVRTILEEELAKANHRGVSLSLDLPRGIHLTFAPASFSELCRVFSNLIGNAVDAAVEGQKKVFVTAQRSAAYCEVSIRDFGKGFDPTVLQRIADGQRGSTKRNGNGLGLATAKSIVEQAGGQLQIQSLGDGALVRVRLPVLETPPWFHDIVRTSADTILALDDDATMERQLSAIFPSKRVSVFKDETDFLAATSQDESALPLVDYDFGGERNGLDLIISQGLTRRAVLLSGRIAFDPKIRITAEANGVRMFPKECLA